MPGYDSRNETVKHINTVNRFIDGEVRELYQRGRVHDKSKLEDPEKAVFDEMTPKLKGTTYPSPEYDAFLAQMRPALEHHYAKNSHHPEHYAFVDADGAPSASLNAEEVKSGRAIRRMNLFDVVEMLCDWKAAGMRHADGGDLRKSIEVNQERFGYGDEFKQLLLNTVPLIEAM